MGRSDNDRIAEVILERRGLRITRVLVDGFDLTLLCRRAEVILDVRDGPLVRLELYARARIEDLERDPVGDLVEDHGTPWPDLDR